MTEAERIAAGQISAAKRAGIVRHEERMRAADYIEMLLYEAKEQETIDVLVRLARQILDPVGPRSA